MKKVIYTLLFAAATLSLAACHDGRDGLDGRDGIDGQDGVMNWDVWEHTIYNTDWALSKSSDNSQSYYYYNITDETQTSYIADSSNVIVYTKYPNSEGTTVWAPMPVTRYFKNTVKNAAGTADSTYTYSITYDYEFAKGFITIYATRSDTVTTQDPGTSNIRVVYNW